MKNLKYIVYTFFAAGLLSSCVSDDDTVLPPYTKVTFAEDFDKGDDNTILATEGWTNFAEAGTALWRIQVYSNNGYAEFSSFSTGEPVNIGWLISPSISLPAENAKKLAFQVSQSFVSSEDNKLEVLISRNFNGTDIAAATWLPLEADLPGTDAEYFEFMSSGEIDLSEHKGSNIHIAFKVTGSGTNTNLDGSYQIDKVRIF